jgi:hypothetical protein
MKVEIANGLPAALRSDQLRAGIVAEAGIERGIAVFSNWAVSGFACLGFVMEGLHRDSYLIALIGIGAVVAGFVGHLIINHVFSIEFTNGETALFLAAFGVLILIFLVAWLTQNLSRNGIYMGLTLVSTVASGLVIYLSTRFGMRGAFSRFHSRNRDGAGGAR